MDADHNKMFDTAGDYNLHGGDATVTTMTHAAMQAMLDTYKSQQSVERGFRFLKSPDFLTASLYLKKPERIEALLMVMTCSLMIYAALEHQIRKNLKEKNLAQNLSEAKKWLEPLMSQKQFL